MNRIFVLCTLLFLVGCSAPKSISQYNDVSSFVVSTANDSQRQETNSIEERSGDLTTLLDQADRYTDDIINNASTETVVLSNSAVLKNTINDAKNQNLLLQDSILDLRIANDRIKKTVPNIIKIESAVQSFELKDEKTRTEGLKNLYQSITMFFVLGFAMMIGGAFVTFWINKKLGGAILGIGILTLGFAAASQYYLEQIAGIGLIVLIVGFVAASGIAAYMILNGKHHEDAMNEIVELIEEMKSLLAPDDRILVFGKHGFASKLTSETTKKIVARIKIKNGFVDKITDHDPVSISTTTLLNEDVV